MTITQQERDRLRYIYGTEPIPSVLVGSAPMHVVNLLNSLEHAENELTRAKALHGEATALVGQLQRENERLESKLDAALDKIFTIQEEWESEGVCAACNICAGIPFEYQPLDHENCRTILEDWACDRPLPWETRPQEVSESAEDGKEVGE